MPNRVARWYICIPKFGYFFGEPCNGKCDIIYGHSIYVYYDNVLFFKTIWYMYYVVYFSSFGFGTKKNLATLMHPGVSKLAIFQPCQELVPKYQFGLNKIDDISQKGSY
jgi:hypothetical protein